MQSQDDPKTGLRLRLDHEEAERMPKGPGLSTEKGTRAIGERLARIRKERGLTQKELAERLGIAQPIVSNYERGELRLHGELLLQLTRVLAVSADELLGIEKPARSPTVRNRQLLRRLQEIDRLPKRDQQALLRTMDAFLAKGRAHGLR